MGAETRLADTHIVGRYAYERELGRGAEGRVLLVRDEDGSPRALKLVAAGAEERVRAEFALLSRIAHPNLARVLELFRVEDGLPGLRIARGTLALVSEFAPGVPADRALQLMAAGSRRGKNERDLQLGLALRVLDRAARALAAVHARGFVHGDVKPANLIVSDDDNALRLIDLGLARAPGFEAQPSGTPDYMAPELFRGELSPAADVYALGVSVWRLLAPQPSAAADASPAELLARALVDPEASEPLPSWVPEPLRALLNAMRAPDRTRRPATARELALEIAQLRAALEPALAGEFSEATAEARTNKERALAIQALPLVGQAAASAALDAALAAGGPVVVCGPEGSGRSRLVRDAVFALQLARSRRGEAVPSYRIVHSVPAKLGAGPTLWHVVGADAATDEEVERFARASEVGAQRDLLVLERTRPLALAAVAQVDVAPLARPDVERLLALALGPGAKVTAELSDEAAAISGGLAARLCRALSAAVAAGGEIARAGQLRGSSGGPAAVPALPKAALALAEYLSIAGGTLAHDRVAKQFEDAAALAEAAQLLAALGLASTTSDGALRLRPDVSRAIWDELGERGRKVRARAIAAARERDGDAPAVVRSSAFLAAASGDPIAAGSSFARSIQQALLAGDPALALELAADARTYLGESEALAGLRAEALRALGRYAEALDVLGDPASPELALLRAEVLRLCGDSTAARAAAAALAQLPAENSLPLRAATLLARLSLDAGELAEADRVARDVLARAGGEPYGLRAAEVLALSLLGRDRGDEARRVLEPALAAARAAGDRAAEARLWSVSGSRSQRAGQLRAAARAFGRAFELADASGEYHAAASFLVNLGTAELDAGELGTALETLREGARRLARLGRERDVARTLYNLALARQLVGDGEDALRIAERARRAAMHAGDHAGAAYATVLCAETLKDRGDAQAARARLETLDECGALAASERMAVSARAASVCAALSDPVGASANLERAESAAAEIEVTEDVELALARSAVFSLRGDATQAQREAEAALTLARERGEFAVQLGSLLAAARAAESRGDASLMRARLSELRAQLDAAALTLTSSDRARLREVRAYRAALAALPTAPLDPTRPSDAVARSDVDGRFRRLTGIAKRLTTESRPRRLFEMILDAAIDLTHAENGFLLLRDGEGELRVRAGRMLGERDQAEGSISQSIVARVLGSGQALSTVDASRDARLSGASSVHALALRSVLVVPLRSGTEIRGVIYLDDRLRPFAFGDDEIALLTDLADLAAIALEAAERLRRERRAVRRLRATQAELARQVEAQAIELASWKGGKQLALEHAGIVAHSPAMRESLELALRVARSEVPVLIRGESGTGKELIAKAIHAGSTRKDAPFVSENCGAIPETLLESTLFGHVKGAFTGADRRHLGLFETANGGTLFLDEIGEMTPAMQVRLLRVLQDGEVRPIGGERASRVDVRVLCATHRDIDRMLESGAFREDLFYRLAVVSVPLPPLRERSEDILPLVKHFLAKYAPNRVAKLDKRLLERLASQAWPGNVRQLENEVRRALALASSDHLREEHFSILAQRAGSGDSADLNLRGRVDELERKLIRRALDAARGNQTRAAELLGVSRFGLQKMLKRLFPAPKEG